MRTVSGTLRLDLAQYRELAAFAQFGSDLDKATQSQLNRGKRLAEILKQNVFVPMDVALQVASVFAGTKGFLDDLRVEAVLPFEKTLHRYLVLRARGPPRRGPHREEDDEGARGRPRGRRGGGQEALPRGQPEREGLTPETPCRT